MYTQQLTDSTLWSRAILATKKELRMHVFLLIVCHLDEEEEGGAAESQRACVVFLDWSVTINKDRIHHHISAVYRAQLTLICFSRTKRGLTSLPFSRGAFPRVHVFGLFFVLLRPHQPGRFCPKKALYYNRAYTSNNPLCVPRTMILYGARRSNYKYSLELSVVAVSASWSSRAGHHLLITPCWSLRAVLYYRYQDTLLLYERRCVFKFGVSTSRSGNHTPYSHHLGRSSWGTSTSNINIISTAAFNLFTGLRGEAAAWGFRCFLHDEKHSKFLLVSPPNIQRRCCCAVVSFAVCAVRTVMMLGRLFRCFFWYSSRL